MSPHAGGSQIQSADQQKSNRPPLQVVNDSALRSHSCRLYLNTSNISKEKEPVKNTMEFYDNWILPLFMIYPKKGLTIWVKEQEEHESRNWFNLIMPGLFISPCNATMQSKEHEKTKQWTVCMQKVIDQPVSSMVCCSRTVPPSMDALAHREDGVALKLSHERNYKQYICQGSFW